MISHASAINCNIIDNITVTVTPFLLKALQAWTGCFLTMILFNKVRNESGVHCITMRSAAQLHYVGIYFFLQKTDTNRQMIAGHTTMKPQPIG